MAWGRWSGIAAGLAAVGLGAATASAATVVNFAPEPVSANVPEFVFSSGTFGQGAGSASNGDGTLPPANQTAPGLTFNTVFSIPGVAGGTVNVDGTTDFRDGGLSLTGFSASGPAGVLSGIIVQPLSPGTITLTATDGTVLLNASVGSSNITAQTGGGAGALFSANNVTYTGGLIYNKLIAAGGTASGNDVSISLNDATPTFSVNGSGILSDFSANGIGQFSADSIPEPTSMGLLAIGATALLARRRRQ